MPSFKRQVFQSSESTSTPRGASFDVTISKRHSGKARLVYGGAQCVTDAQREFGPVVIGERYVHPIGGLAS